MDEHLVADKEDDKDKLVRGSLLNRMIRQILTNRWTTGWGLISEKGSNGGIISLDPRVIPAGTKGFWRGKVTSSSGTAEEHTIEEVDRNDAIIPVADGGRKSTQAKALNGRKGVPTDTFVIVFDIAAGSSGGEPVRKFLIPDGLTDTPKDLVADGLTASAVTYDIEVDSSPVQVNNGRVWFGTPIMAAFWREATYDASGMLTNLSGESRFRLIADLDDASYTGAIALVADGVDGGYLKHNQPQDTTYTLTLQSNDASVTFNGGASSATVTFDEGGHYNQGNASVSIESVGGGGGADGQGYEIIEVNDVQVQANADDGVLNFNDGTTSGTTLGVTFAGAVDGVNAEQVNITGTVDASGLSVTDFGGGSEVVDIEIRVSEAAGSGTYTIDADNYSHRMIHSMIHGEAIVQQSDWDETVNLSVAPVGTYVGPNYAVGDINLFSITSEIDVYIDISDGFKLKMDYSSPFDGDGGTTAFHFVRVFVQKGVRKTAADQTITT